MGSLIQAKAEQYNIRRQATVLIGNRKMSGLCASASYFLLLVLSTSTFFELGESRQYLVHTKDEVAPATDYHDYDYHKFQLISGRDYQYTSQDYADYVDITDQDSPSIDYQKGMKARQGFTDEEVVPCECDHAQPDMIMMACYCERSECGERNCYV